MHAIQENVIVGEVGGRPYLLPQKDTNGAGLGLSMLPKPEAMCVLQPLKLSLALYASRKYPACADLVC